MDEKRHGFVATTARFIETWFLVVFGGPRTYSYHDLPSRYASPGEFLFLLLLISGIASLGYGALFRHSGDTGLTPASAATLLAAMLASTTTWFIWAASSVVAARIVRVKLPLAGVWRVAAYSTAPSMVAFPIMAVWRIVLEKAFPAEALGDTISYALPTLLFVPWTLAYFFLGIWRQLPRRRVAHAATTLLLIGSLPTAAFVIADLPVVANFIERTRFASFSHDPRDGTTLFVWKKDAAAGVGRWDSRAAAADRETISTRLYVRNSSAVTARNTWIQLQWAYDKGTNEAILIARISCSNCARQYLSTVEILIPPNCVLRPAHAEVRSALRNEPRTLPGSALEDIRQAGAIVGEVLPGDYASFNIFADYVVTRD
jgi:hypothetical protein